jgi:hypothetical protein
MPPPITVQRGAIENNVIKTRTKSDQPFAEVPCKTRTHLTEEYF